MQHRPSRRATLLGLVATGVMLAALLPTAGVLAQITPAVITPATGGTGISTTTAASGGSGTYTNISGPMITESVGGQLANATIGLSLPSGFEFNPNITTAPVLSGTGCAYTASALTYFGTGNGSTSLQTMLGGTTGTSDCTIQFKGLQVRPLTTTPASGNIDVVVNGSSAGNGGAVSSVAPAPTPTPTPTPPPPGKLSLTITSPTMNNNAIIWGQSYIDIRTAGSPGTTFQIQASTDNATWTPLKNSSGSVLSWTIGSAGYSTYKYTPIRNYWYKSVAGSTTSNVVRITVRETCSLAPMYSTAKTVAAGTTITFNATVRPARSDLPKANVVFQVYKKSGSGWVLNKSVTKLINDSGVAALTWTFASGSWYVRAQAQPTSVNSNSFWTPNSYVNAS